jgi:hypothetical protein
LEIKIGVQNVGREIVLESAQDPETVAKTVGEAINEGTQLRLKDDKGRLIIVPGNALAYVEIGAEEARRVGFGQF